MRHPSARQEDRLAALPHKPEGQLGFCGAGRRADGQLSQLENQPERLIHRLLNGERGRDIWGEPHESGTRSGALRVFPPHTVFAQLG